jgi:hypothetical protein
MRDDHHYLKPENLTDSENPRIVAATSLTFMSELPLNIRVVPDPPRGYVVHLCSGGFCFEYWPGHQLSGQVFRGFLDYFQENSG